MNLLKEIDDAIKLCEIEIKKNNDEYLITIIKILEGIKNSIIMGKIDKKQKELNAAGFTKIILDNYSFAMSELGNKLLRISKMFAECKN